MGSESTFLWLRGGFLWKRAFGLWPGLVFFHAVHYSTSYTFSNIPFVFGPRFANRDGPALGGTVYQLGAGGEFMPPLSCFTSMEANVVFSSQFNNMEVRKHLWRKKVEINFHGYKIYIHGGKTNKIVTVKSTSSTKVKKASWKQNLLP